MAIKRYVANADNTITNAFDGSLVYRNRASGSNMGRSDVLEVFSIYGQVSGSNLNEHINGQSAELSRVILNFPISEINTDRTNNKIPASGSISWYLRMFNAPHAQTLPRDYTMDIKIVSQSWQEGDGLDMDNYTDKTYDVTGSNWMKAAAGSNWTNAAGDTLIGGSYHASPIYTYDFGDKGTKDLEVDVSYSVEEWLNGNTGSYGFGVMLSSSFEAYFSSSTNANTGSVVHNLEGSKRSYYTKKFFARESEFFFKRPILEARWDDTIKDDRGGFYYSSSLAPASENLNTIYLYNYIRGRLRNIPGVGTGEILVSIYSGSADDSAPSGSKLLLPVGGGVVSNLHTNITGAYVSTGIYSASFAITAAATPLQTLYDVWHSGGVELNTGSITPLSFDALEYNGGKDAYVVNIKNMKKSYSTDDTARFRLFVRKKNWSPTMYTVANATAETLIIPSASYKVVRIADNQEVIEYGSGSVTNHTELSYDNLGNYFNLDMSMLEPGYMYGIKLAFYDDAVGDYIEQKHTFKFRVEEDNE